MHQRSRLSLFGERPNGTSIKRYRITFLEDGRGSQKDVDFEAQDAATALVIAHKEASNRSAELWCDGRKLCTIKRAREDFWEIRTS